MLLAWAECFALNSKESVIRCKTDLVACGWVSKEVMEAYGQAIYRGSPFDLAAHMDVSGRGPCIQRKGSNSFHLINDSLQLMTVIAERDAALLEKNTAMAEKMAAITERDAALMQRDIALSDRDQAILGRDAAMAALARLEREAPGRSRRKAHSSNSTGLLNGSKLLQRVGLAENSTGAADCQSSGVHASHSGIMVLDGSDHHTGMHGVGNEGEPPVQIFLRQKRKAPDLMDGPFKSKPSRAPPKKIRNWQLIQQGHQQEGMVQVDDEDEEGQIPESALVIHGGARAASAPTPIPYCSCTGVNQQCYRWGNGGWQSACCTTMISMHPLPMNPKKRGSRLAGRKMSAGAFEKLLEKLASEGANISYPVDLREHWAKHGTNRYVTLRWHFEANFIISARYFYGCPARLPPLRRIALPCCGAFEGLWVSIYLLEERYLKYCAVTWSSLIPKVWMFICGPARCCGSLFLQPESNSSSLAPGHCEKQIGCHPMQAFCRLYTKWWKTCGGPVWHGILIVAGDLVLTSYKDTKSDY